VEAWAREVALDQQLVEFFRALNGGDEDHKLVEFEGVYQVDQFPVLLVFCQVDVELLEPVEPELGPVVDEKLEWL
jgi:hypothetical protein